MHKHTSIIPFIIFAVSVVILVLTMTGLANFLGKRSTAKNRNRLINSDTIGNFSNRSKYPEYIQIIVMFFVFDIEALFIVVWSVAFKHLNWILYTAVAVIIGVIISILIYQWRVGALDFMNGNNKVPKEIHNDKD